MSSLCPQCQAKLSEFAFECEKCDWRLVDQIEEPRRKAADQHVLETDLHLERAMDAIEESRFADAILSMNRAIADATPERLAECHSLRGYAYLKHGEFQKAELECTISIDSRPNDPQTYAWRAAARGEQNNWREAFDDLAEACNQSGDERDPYLRLMQSYLRTASEYYREQIKTGNRSAELFSNRGWVYLNAENIEKSQRDFEQALKLDPHHGWAAFGMASSIFTSRALDKDGLAAIVRFCGIAIENNGECALNALSLRAKANRRFGRVAKSAKDLRLLSEQSKDDPQQLMRCGELRQSLGDCLAAITDFSRAIELNPERHAAIKKRADCFFEIRNYPHAIEDYTRFIQFYPDDLTARIKRGRAYIGTNRLERALVDFDRALTVSPNNFDARLGRSEIFCKQKRPDEALTECQKAVEKDNTRADGFASLGEVYMLLCDYGRAIEEFGHAIQLAKKKNDRAEYLYRRGVANYELNLFDLALEDFDQATTLRPSHSGSWVWKAAACSRLEKFGDAILGLKQAIAVQPAIAQKYQKLGKPVAERAIEFFNHQQQRIKPTVQIYRSRGLAYQFLGKQDEAIQDFTAALNFDPDHDETLIRRGNSFAQMGDHDSAADDFKSVIRNDEKNHRARYWRALSRSAMGAHSNALVDVVKAIKASALVPAYHVLHGELLNKIGKHARAIRAFDRAIRLDSSDPQTYRRRAVVHAHQNEFLEAIRDFTRSLEFNPASAETLVLRGHSYLKVGQHSEAINDFELALTLNDRIAKAYAGRAAALTAEYKYEYATIWLTKAIHRFIAPRDLSEVIFARGKVFYQMKRFEPAVADFSAVAELMRAEPKTLAAARLARGVARVQLDQLDQARADFKAVAEQGFGNKAAASALDWLDNQERPRPEILAAPDQLVRPTRPPVIGSEIDLPAEPSKWNTGVPYNTWILRTINRKEYGPIRKDMLDQWVSEGRIVAGMKVLRADWGKWKRAEKIYPVLESKQIEIFPAINLVTDSEIGENPESNS